jgi:hypothetical protein
MHARITLVAAFGLAASLSAGGCHRPPANTPDAVADRFVDDYFVLIDQKQALPLTTALAHQKLETEIAEVETVRNGATEAPDDAKQDVSWQRTYFDPGPAGSQDARATYTITIKPRQGGTTLTRQTFITLHDDAGQWKVADFTYDNENP